ncbi:MAG TPA: VOC family protein [Rhodopila sp.]|uniref:VOC family protein n=1 Tax=Rhodopila sp. TaxID=2480087 RepID=UPI002C5155E3|nr:VOC family protein [Rhodopila sp.]HVY13877.1 VOC family protein [Rhodopila sp.]
MLDHIGLTVSDFARIRNFYTQALEPLDITVVMEVSGQETGAGAHAGFGQSGKPSFWIGSGNKPSGPVHVAFTASTRKQVEDFYAAALAAGGRDNGRPGLRPHYHASYYAAFVLDPDGNNIEAVCHDPSG